MVERFFFKGQTSFQLPYHQPDSVVLLSGPPSSGKTSLLFQFAFNSVVEKNGTVLIICNRRRLEINPPFLSHGVDPSSEVFQRIQMKYVDDDEGIKNYFAAFHMQDTFPVSVIIDNFADFFDARNCQEKYNNPRGKELAMVRTLALCANAINHAKAKGGCNLLLSDTHQGDSPRLLYIYKRWISSIYTIRGRGDGSGSFILKGSYSNITTRAKYSIALQYLVLEGIGEDVEEE